MIKIANKIKVQVNKSESNKNNNNINKLATISIQKKKARIPEIRIKKKDFNNEFAEILNKLGLIIPQLNNRDGNNNY